MLRSARTVIVDEIHAVAGNKRGSHLALTLERLAHVAEQPVQRVGLSATQRPIETVARLLVGAGPDRDDPDGTPRCAIVDVRPPQAARPGPRAARRRARRGPVRRSRWREILDRIAGHVTGHRTTLVFVNTRRMAERVAHQLGERLGRRRPGGGAPRVACPRSRGSGSRPGCGPGDLRALVATASLELGIDIGPVELVCQIGSPRSLATFLQRVGRSNHTRTGTPSGRLYPTTRDELVECAALLRGVRPGRLDAIVVAGTAAGHPGPADGGRVAPPSGGRRTTCSAWSGGPRRSRDLSAEDFDEVVELVAEGIRTGRGRRRRLPAPRPGQRRRSGRRGARLAALTSGGAIPELGDYRVRGRTRRRLRRHRQRGLGHRVDGRATSSCSARTSWRIRRVEPGTVRVADAHGAPPSVPFWLGEAPGRTRELSEEVSALRAGGRGGRRGRPPPAQERWLEAGVRDRPGRGRHHRGLPAAPGWPRSARCRPWTPSSWSGSSTRRAGCSWSGTRRSGRG